VKAHLFMKLFAFRSPMVLFLRDRNIDENFEIKNGRRQEKVVG